MLKTELKLPFTFYNALNKQHRYRVQNTGEIPYPLICYGSALLPFEVRVTLSSTVTQFGIYSLENILAFNLNGNINRISTYSDSAYTWLIYKGAALTSAIPPGCYWVRIVAGGNTYYSEVFKIVPTENFMQTRVELRWSSYCDIAPVIYSTGYENKLFLDTYIEAIEPEFLEEGEENGAGEFVPTLQRLVCKQKIECFAPDYLLDALAFMQMHPTIVVSDFTDSNVPIKRVKVSNNYGENFIGKSKIEFEFGDDYTRTGCCVPPEEPPECIPASFAGPTALPDGTIGDAYSFTIALAGTVPFTLGSPVTKPAWMTITIVGSSVVFGGTPNVEASNVSVGFTVNNCTSSELPFSDHINTSCIPAVIPELTLSDAVAGMAYSYTFDLDGTAPFAINTIVKPAWMTINLTGRTITFSGTPDAGDVDTDIEVSFTITNGCGSDGFSDLINVLQTYECGDVISAADWTENTFHDYGYFYLDLSAATGAVNLAWESFDRPNIFTVTDNLGNTIGNTGWVGFADYVGPWGSSLSTAENGTITFTPVVGRVYKIRVVTGNGNGLSDNWNVTVGC